MTPDEAHSAILSALRHIGWTGDEAREIVECFAARLRAAGREEADCLRRLKAALDECADEDEE